ncbi:helix-turn-helix domain-containing protein [Qipengyuania soli]|uniref:Helix-turn-helix domain-containing protein n=1 Tax=Qipengyuania soli TaxID=2782568 RepID=A0A7S8F2A6_9SPHN|nr:helix-turn-helix domain-containing protein [Qipengyuania soli]QPC97824.1 helix-turn-helix domain-containing protein [Qipengyuania soli]
MWVANGESAVSDHGANLKPGVSVSYALPAGPLRRYISTYSQTVVAPGSPTVFDQVYPEWPNIRLTAGGDMAACTGPGPLQPCNPICAIGPTSHSTHFSLAPGRYWTISLLPLGWAQLVGIRAAEFADRWEVIGRESSFAAFAPLLDCAGQDDDFTSIAARFDAHLLAMLKRPARREETILKAHDALLDPEVTTVDAFAERAGTGVRALERLSLATFGFSPKLLLRRQRFLRSLSQFMLDPSLAWIDTLDHQYVDQAHFIRDFRRFMDTTPGAFAAAPHPVLWAAAVARTAIAGKPMQVLQRPSESV